MKLGINTGFFSPKYDEHQSIEQVAAAGFNCCDYSMYLYAVPGSVYDEGDWRGHLAKIRLQADRLGLQINQMHAPLFKYMGEESNESFKVRMTQQCFEACHILGCKHLVIHAQKFRQYQTEQQKATAIACNLAIYQDYIPLAKQFGVTIALENLFRYDTETGCPIDTNIATTEEMACFLRALPSEHFAVCLDTGHAHINSIAPGDMLNRLGGAVQVLHLHDNLKIVDSHLPPYSGTIDWAHFMQSLRAVGFNRVFSFELMPSLPHGLESYARYIQQLGTDMLRAAGFELTT